MSALLAFRAARLTLRGRTIIDELTLTVAPGERVALIGPNGAGKTTILRAALGLLAPARGEIMLGECAPAALSGAERARRAAYLPQRASAAWPIRVDALAALGRFAYGAPITRLSPADAAAIDQALTATDMARLRDRPLDALSGGEQARAHLARALAQQAPLLVLDEPTANLDPAQSARVAQIIAGHDGAALFATHDFPAALKAATRALVIADGAIIADGPPREAMAPAHLERAFGAKARMIETEAGPCVVFG